MKQRVRVIGIIGEEEALLLKRTASRADREPVWELPTGKIKFGEQPEEALTRALLENVGVHAQKVTLRDAVTLTAPDLSGLANLYLVYGIEIGEEKIAPSGRYSAFRRVKLGGTLGVSVDESTRLLIGIIGARAGLGEATPEVRSTAQAATVVVDGCSRGNPGPAGAGYYIVDASGRLLKEGGEYLGFATSRVAEYYAMKEGCEQALDLGLKSVRFVSDNLMLVNQLNGIYQVKNLDLVPIYENVRKLLRKFEHYAVVHCPRAQTLSADRQANRAVDAHFSKSG